MGSYRGPHNPQPMNMKRGVMVYLSVGLLLDIDDACRQIGCDRSTYLTRLAESDLAERRRSAHAKKGREEA